MAFPGCLEKVLMLLAEETCLESSDQGKLCSGVVTGWIGILEVVGLRLVVCTGL